MIFKISSLVFGELKLRYAKIPHIFQFFLISSIENFNVKVKNGEICRAKRVSIVGGFELIETFLL